MMDIWDLGTHIKNAIKKYGKENFKKEIITECNSFEEMNELERKIVDKNFIHNSNTYNHAIGGTNGWKNCLKYKSEEEIKEIRQHAVNAMRDVYKDPIKRNEYVKKIKDGQKAAEFNHKTFLGKHHTEETKKKMSEIAKTHTGEKNSSFGTCWIFNEKESKKIKKDEIQKYLELGWKKGRKMF